jgi:hypothetical protein
MILDAVAKMLRSLTQAEAPGSNLKNVLLTAGPTPHVLDAIAFGSARRSPLVAKANLDHSLASQVARPSPFPTRRKTKSTCA